MPKITYNAQNAFLGGLAPFPGDLVGGQGQYKEGRDVDPNRKPGYIMPGLQESNIDNSSNGTMASKYINIVVDPDNGNTAYGMNDSGGIDKLTGATFDNVANSRTAATIGSTRGEDIIAYFVGSTNYLFYFYDNEGGRFDLSSTFDDDYMSTQPSGSAQLNDAPHPVGIFPGNNRLYIGNGQYLAEFNGASGANGTLSDKVLDLGDGWEITSLFMRSNFIGICAWKKNQDVSERTQCAVFTWDSVSDKPNDFIPIEDNFIEASFNNYGRIFLLTKGRNFAVSSSLRVLSEQGTTLVQEMRFDIGGSGKSFDANTKGAQIRNVMDAVDNRLVFALSRDDMIYIFAYGASDEALPEGINVIGSSTNNDANGNVGCIRHLTTGNILMSYDDGTNGYYSRFTNGSSGNSNWKGQYASFDSTVSVKRIKVFFDDVDTASDSFAVTLDTNEGTSNTLYDGNGNSSITNTNHSGKTAITLPTNIQCHRFRPSVTWSSGDTAIAQIAVQYEQFDDLPVE